MERLAFKIAFSSRAEATLESVRLAVRPIKILFGTIQTSTVAATHGGAYDGAPEVRGVNSELVPGKKLPDLKTSYMGAAMGEGDFSKSSQRADCSQIKRGGS